MKNWLLTAKKILLLCVNSPKWVMTVFLFAYTISKIRAELHKYRGYVLRGSRFAFLR